VVYSEKIELPIKERVRYGLSHAASKSLYIWTDNGKLYQITPSDQAWALARESRVKYEAFKRGNVQMLTESEKTLAQCIECHSGTVISPPDLTSIIGKKIASSTYTGYSDALKNLGGVWGEENLRAYLMNPQSFAEGTSMPDQQIRSVGAVDKIIDALKTLGNRH
jgi:cytochrome c2